MSELPWIYQIPALLLTGLCIILGLFAFSGYEFRLFWRCVEIGPPRRSVYLPPKEKEPARLPATNPPKSITDANRPKAGTAAIAAGSNPQKTTSAHKPMPIRDQIRKLVASGQKPKNPAKK
uniref:Uncharacterized protein n=1 Tax=Plectus sambesii TaxID=2011161 RepID=A0A914V6B4_9BILA